MNRRSFLMTAAGALSTAMSGCGLMKNDAMPELITAKNLDRLVDRDWILRTISVDSSSIVMHVDANMTIRFESDTFVRGFGAINQFARGYKFDDTGLLTWTHLDFALTKKGGPPELLEKEKAYLRALNNVTRAFAGKSSLTLQNGDGNTALAFFAPGFL